MNVNCRAFFGDLWLINSIKESRPALDIFCCVTLGIPFQVELKSSLQLDYSISRGVLETKSGPLLLLLLLNNQIE